MSAESNSNTIRTYFAAIRAMDVEACVRTFAPDGVNYDPVGTPPNVGHAALGQFFSAIMGVFETVGLTEDHIFIAGNGAAVKWTGRGKGKNGREVKFEGIDVFDFDESGLIKSVNAYWNPAEVMLQLQA